MKTIDEMHYYAAFHLGLHCLQNFSFRGPFVSAHIMASYLNTQYINSGNIKNYYCDEIKKPFYSQTNGAYSQGLSK